MRNLEASTPGPVHPLTKIQEPGNEFDSVDLSVIDFPDKPNPIQDAYHQTMKVKPDEAAQVVKLSSQTGQPPQFVADNLDAAKKAAAVPSNDYFAEISKKYPGSAAFLSDLKNMVMAHDDIESFKNIEKIVQGTMVGKAVNASLDAAFPMGFGAFAAKVGRDFRSMPIIPVSKIIGNADFGRTEMTYSDFLDKNNTETGRTIKSLIKSRSAVAYGAVKGAAQLAEGISTGENISILAAMTLAPETALAGLPRMASLVQTIASGGFAIQMAKDLPEVYKQIKEAHANGNTEEVARLSVLGAGQLVMAALSVKGAAEHSVDLAAEHVSQGMERFSNGGNTKIIEPAQQQYFKGYTQIGREISTAKLTERSNEAQRNFVGSVVKDSDLQEISIPATAFETYFQSKNIDPSEMADKMGVKDQLEWGKQSGGDIKIPFEDWAGELAKTPHYEALKDDIRFKDGMPTVNEGKLTEATVGKQMDEAVKGAAKENPEWEQGRQIVMDQFTRQLIESKAYNSADVVTQAETGARIIERLAAMNGDKSPSDYLAKHPIEIVNGEMVASPGNNNFKTGDILVTKVRATTAEGKETWIDQKYEYDSTSKAGKVRAWVLDDLGKKTDTLVNLDPKKESLTLDNRVTELNQDATPDPLTSPRASISFQSEKALISLKNADPSSFMHEMSHYWLKNFSEFINTGNPGESHLADWGVLKDWLKIEEGAKELTVDQQEKFARGFEKYLYEGKAPSEGLRGAFKKFSQWLRNVYRDASQLGVELTPEVRKVMDRMLASEDEIAFAERTSNLAEQYGDLEIDPKVRAKLTTLREEAHDAAFDQLFKQQMEEISKENIKKLTSEEAKAHVKFLELVKESEIQQAIRAVKANFSGDPIKTAQDFWLNKMGDSSLLVNNPDRARFEQLAEARGFSCGEEMAQKIVEERPVDEQVQALVDQHMAQFADLKDTEKIKEAALLAVHNDKSTELMAREAALFQEFADQAQGKAINAKINAEKAKIEAQAAKEKAKVIISSKNTAEARKFLPFFTAERSAAVRVKKALLDKDYGEAAKAKREQMISHALVREAYAFKNEYAKKIRISDKWAARGQDLKDIPYGFVRQIDTLFSDRGLMEPRAEDAETYKMVAADLLADGQDTSVIAHRTGYIQDENGAWKQETVADTIDRIHQDYRDVNIPESVITNPAVDYRKMKVQDFRDLYEAVDSIAKIGRRYDNFLDEKVKGNIDEWGARFAYAVRQKIGEPMKEGRLPYAKHGETAFDRTYEAFNNARGILTPSLTNLYSYCYHLGDIALDRIYRPLLHAFQDEIKMKEEVAKGVEKTISDHFTPKEYAAQKSEKVWIKSLDADWTRDQVQAFANNWGTLQGRDRATNQLDGTKMPKEVVDEILSKVTKQQWDKAQATWDYNDTLWPKIVALEEKASGKTPKKVTPEPIETPYGTYEGGYYSLKYDRAQSSEAIKNIDERNALYKTQGAVSAHTAHGFTNSRALKYNQPILLDTSVEYTHLEEVVHDLTHRKAIIDVARFLRNKDVRQSIINAVGREGYDTIQQHVKWVASDQGEYLNGIADKLLQRLRFGTTMAALAIRPAAAVMDMGSNIISSVWQLGPRKFSGAIKDFMSDRENNVRLVDQKMPAMEHRASLRDSTLKDMDEKLQGNSRLITHLMFYLQTKADEAISYPLALHVYKENLAEFGEQKAIDMGYEAVVATIGDGSTLNQSMIQRGSQSDKMWAWFYSWAGTQFNHLWRDGKIAGLEYDKGNIGPALQIVGKSVFYGVGLMAANEAFWKDMVFRNANHPNDDKRNKRMMIRIPAQALGYIPVLGPIAQYGLNKTMGGTQDLNLPAVSAIQTAVDPIWEWARERYTGKHSPHFWEDTAKSAAIIARYPNYINTIAFNLLDNINGKADANWRDLFTRKTKN